MSATLHMPLYSHPCLKIVLILNAWIPSQVLYFSVTPWTGVCNSLFLKDSVPASHTQQHSLQLDLGQSKTYNMLLTGDCFQGQKKYTVWKWNEEIIFYANGNNKESKGSNTHIRQIDF